MVNNERPEPDWDVKSDVVLRNQLAACDEMRERCPVVYSEFLGWSLFRHEDVVRVLNDHDTFSNAVSRHLSVPDGMDPPEHTEYRRIVESYFRPELMQAFEAQFRDIAADLVQALFERHEVELIAEFAHHFAVRVQCTFLGWPMTMHEPLRLWTQNNHPGDFCRGPGGHGEDRPRVRRLCRRDAAGSTCGRRTGKQRHHHRLAAPIGQEPTVARRRDRQHPAQLDCR